MENDYNNIDQTTSKKIKTDNKELLYAEIKLLKQQNQQLTKDNFTNKQKIINLQNQLKQTLMHHEHNIKSITAQNILNDFIILDKTAGINNSEILLEKIKSLSHYYLNTYNIKGLQFLSDNFYYELQQITDYDILITLSKITNIDIFKEMFKLFSDRELIFNKYIKNIINIDIELFYFIINRTNLDNLFNNLWIYEYIKSTIIVKPFTFELLIIKAIQMNSIRTLSIVPLETIIAIQQTNPYHPIIQLIIKHKNTNYITGKNIHLFTEFQLQELFSSEN